MSVHLNRRVALASARISTAALCVLFAGAVNASADVIHVYEGESIQDAIDVAVDGDEVIVHPGTYYEVIDNWYEDITIRSSDGPEVTILDGRYDYDEAVVGCGAGVFEGFTVTNGWVTNGPGGVEIGSATVRNCIIVYNYSDSGGGCSGTGAGLGAYDDSIVIDCVIRENVALGSAYGGSGGGALVTQSGTPIFVNCLFEGNVAWTGYDWPGGASDGGAMLNFGHTTLINCRFTGNRATSGAAIANSGINSTIHDSKRGVVWGTIVAVNCIFSGNAEFDPYDEFDGYGGAITTVADDSLVNCTFTGNRADSGGALYIRDFGGQAKVTNCVFWDNTPNQIVDETNEAVTYCCVQGGWTGEGNIDANPLFLAEGRWDDNGTPNDPHDDIWMDGAYQLRPGSPVIDAGNNTEVPDDITTDFAGNPRFVDDPDTEDTGFGDPPIVDMGAYEFQVEDTCPCDVNDDEVVNIDDLFDVLAHWGEGAGPYDVNDDGVVDIDDIFDVLGDWGPCP